MSLPKSKKKSIYTARAEYADRTKKENESFKEVVVPIQEIQTALLLLNSQEDAVLLTVFKNITEYARKQEENIEELKKLNLLDTLLKKKLFIDSEVVMIRRFAMYLACALIESINVLQDMEPEKTKQILQTCTDAFLKEVDDFGLEYLTVVINKCLDDPQVALEMLNESELLEKFFLITAKTENPDILWQSFEAIHKMLLLLDGPSMQAFSTLPSFPIDRVLCDITNEFKDIRSAALKVIKDLVVDTSEETIFADVSRCVYTLQQLTKLFCDHATTEHGVEAIEALATAMRTEKMTNLFFEHNLFDRIIQNVNENMLEYMPSVTCKVIWIFAENAKYEQYLTRIFEANVTDLLLDCLLKPDPLGPAYYVIAGLNRMMKCSDAANRMLQLYEAGVVERLTYLISQPAIDIRTREQAADLINNLLRFAFHPTAQQLLGAEITQVLGKIFGQQQTDLSVDFQLSLLNIVEQLAQNDEYRAALAQTDLLATNIALMLKNSFATAILVNNIFRCLCTLVEEEPVRAALLTHYIAASMKRGLKSLSNLVKTSVTNFIMQTTRFPEMVHEYIEMGVLEVLILNQKLAHCVSTWGPAIEAILSKCPSLKFCIRNHLGFTDSTAGNDFLVSKKKFDDFRVFQNILKEEVSPLHPILVVNFERFVNPPELVIEVPIECFPIEERQGISTEIWCYCRKPGDKELPRILDHLNNELDRYGILENPAKMSRCIDFDNLAKRAKVIADVVEAALGNNLKRLDLNTSEEWAQHTVQCHLNDIAKMLHCNFIPMGMIRSGCQFERAILFKVLADQIGLPCTLQRAVDGRLLFNEVPLPVEIEQDIHCDNRTMKFMPWRMLRPTHIVDLMFNVGELYPIQSRQALQYLRLY
ncbi:armadillo repeat-containing protein 3 [Eurosta solidaginis]|uniref:armadillo repeat-containing protein 3 n=1 Tax=Eurosta solidaginis TaxID=178769 RepID=UPI0035314EA3